MTRSRLILAALFAGTVAAAFFGVRMLRAESPTPDAASVPVVEVEMLEFVPEPWFGDPVEYEAEAAALDHAIRTAASEEGIGLPLADSYSVVGYDPDSLPVDPAEPVFGPDEETVDPDAPGPPSSPSGGGRTADDIVLDVCAFEEADYDCPEGVGGTILLAFDALPPFEGMFLTSPYAPGTAPFPWLPECPDRELEPNQTLVGWTANRPFTTVLTLLDSAGVNRTSDFTAGSRPSVTAQWHEWFAEEGRDPADPRQWIRFCSVHLLAPGLYELSAVFTDTEFGDTFRYPDPGTIGYMHGDPPRDRRPTVVLPFRDQVWVNATAAENQSLVAWGVPAAASCQAPADVRSLWEPPSGVVYGFTQSSDLIDPAVLEAEDYPYRRDHVRTETKTLRLEPGSDYLLCLFWVDWSGPTFNPSSISTIEEIPISTPEAYKVRVSIDAIRDRLGRLDGTDVHRLSVEVVGRTTGECAGFYHDFNRSFEVIYPRGVLCDGIFGFAGAGASRQGLKVRLMLDGEDGQRWVFRQVRIDGSCPVVPCPPASTRRTEYVVLPLPDLPVDASDCGSGFGEGCLSGGPRRPPGSVILAIDYLDGARNGLSSFVVGEPREFDADAELPEIPLLDVTVTEITPSTEAALAAGSSVRVDVVVDRPITVAARLIPFSPAAESCFVGAPRDGVYGHAGPTAMTTHSFTIEGLCAASDYRLIFTDWERPLNPTLHVVPAVGASPMATMAFRTEPLTLALQMTVVAEPPPPAVLSDRRWEMPGYNAYNSLTLFSPPETGIANQVPRTRIDWDHYDVARESGWLFRVQNWGCSEFGVIEPWTKVSDNTTVFIDPNHDVLVTARVWFVRNTGSSCAPLMPESPSYLRQEFQIRTWVSVEELLGGFTAQTPDGRFTFYLRGVPPTGD